MHPPEPYRHSFVALQNIPYVAGDLSSRQASHSGGVLGRGQLVWTKGPETRQSRSVTAFVEELGIVSLDPRWLVPADVLQEK